MHQHARTHAQPSLWGTFHRRLSISQILRRDWCHPINPRLEINLGALAESFEEQSPLKPCCLRKILAQNWSSHNEGCAAALTHTYSIAFALGCAHCFGAVPAKHCMFVSTEAKIKAHQPHWVRFFVFSAWIFYSQGRCFRVWNINLKTAAGNCVSPTNFFLICGTIIYSL